MKIFLSYAREDKDRVLELYRKLHEDGYDAWLDSEKILAGQDWDLEINKAIKTSDAIILCFTDISVRKEGYIQREMKKAIDIAQEKLRDTIFIIPTRLDECAVPEEVSRWQYVDLFSETGYEKLLSSLKLKANQQSAPIHQKVASVEPVNRPNNKLIKFQEIAEQLYKHASAALQENQAILTPALQGLETPEQAIQKLVGVFHRQQSRGFFAKQAAYLSEAIKSLDAESEERTIVQDLLNGVNELIDIFYSLQGEGKGRFVTKWQMISRRALLSDNSDEILSFFANYLESLRIQVANIATIVGKLSAMLD